jgi:hypothetical protein
VEALLKEIENNLATLKCKLEEQGITSVRIEADLWSNSIGFEIGVYTGAKWLGDPCLHEIASFIEAIEREKILFRKFNGGV